MQARPHTPTTQRNSKMSLPIPELQKAAVIENPGPQAKITIQNNVPVGTPVGNEILVKLTHSGICRSEIRAFLGWGPYRSIIGHEGVGTVVKLGEKVHESMLGQRVGVKWLYSACGDCSACSRDYPNNCPSQLNTGKQVPGTLQQYVVADARYITKIPTSLASEIAAPLLCAGLTMAGAVSKLEGELFKGDWVVVSGSGGGLGHVGVQIASRLNGYRVIAIDSGQSKRELSFTSGAEHFIDYSEEDIESRVKEITGEGAHAVLIVSGSETAFETAPKLVRNMGLIVTIGLPPNDYNIPIPASLCSARALTVTGVATGTERQMEALLDQAATGKISPAVEILNLDEISGIFERLKNDEITGRIVVRIPE
ncbi:chaperonin 10-like protein [Thelonectria olida]|uniref:Chaperonin 10-like protein n=1 Tax=Thelonectria olida TaxID=1576542 RepID=A0A9P8W3F5_9HYPO|nr:chaperonin 10-like protein [Thelonectria olida]